MSGHAITECLARKNALAPSFGPNLRSEGFAGFIGRAGRVIVGHSASGSAGVTLQIIWRKTLHAIWRILRVWTNWRGLPERPESAPLIDSTCSNLTWKMTGR